MGNAGLKSVFSELSQVILNNKEPSIIRITAIESTRHLGKSLKTIEKIQKLLLPIIVNVDEEKIVRMTAIQMIMRSSEELSATKNIVDQILFAINNENSEEIKEYVYSLIKAGTKSPIPNKQKFL